MSFISEVLLIRYFFKISHSPASCLLSLLHVPPSHKKIYIPLSLVHLINTAGDNCMRLLVIHDILLHYNYECNFLVKNCFSTSNF